MEARMVSDVLVHLSGCSISILKTVITVHCCCRVAWDGSGEERTHQLGSRHCSNLTQPAHPDTYTHYREVGRQLLYFIKSGLFIFQ